MSVFLLWWEIVLWREIVLKMRTSFDFLWAVSTKKSYWVTLLWFDSLCVYFVRPNTLLLCIFHSVSFSCTTQIHKLIQIRILLKDEYVKSCQNANTSNHTLISWTVRIPQHRFKENFYLGFFIKEKQLASQFVFLLKSKHWVLANIWFIVCLGFFLAGLSFESFYFSKSRLCTRPLKNIENFLWKKKSVNNRSIPSMHADREITVCSHKHSFTPYLPLSPYSPTDGITERRIHLLRVGWRIFFPVVLLCQFFGFWWEIGFGITYLRM